MKETAKPAAGKKEFVFALPQNAEERGKEDEPDLFDRQNVFEEKVHSRLLRLFGLEAGDGILIYTHIDQRPNSHEHMDH